MNSEAKRLSALKPVMDSAWRYVWDKLFDPGTKLFYDCLTDHPSDPLRGYLPTPEEIALKFPNSCGWNTGMEDSMLNGGPALSMLVDRWELTKDDAFRQLAFQVYEGMAHCAKVSGVRGFLARSVSPVDGKSHYINSSRDQYTLFIWAMRKFRLSALSTEAQKREIARTLVDFAFRCESCVSADTGYELLRSDGESGLVCKMWGAVEEHEILRLPMFYAAAWEASGDAHWFELYRRYVEYGQSFAAKIKHPKFPGFALLQMQASQRVLWEIEPDRQLKENYAKIMRATADIALQCMHESERLYRLLGGFLGHFNKDWRKCPLDYLERAPVNGVIYVKALIPEDYRNSMIAVREAGEGILVQGLCPGYEISASQRERFCEAARRVDYECHATCGPLLQLAAYWSLERAAL